MTHYYDMKAIHNTNTNFGIQEKMGVIEPFKSKEY